jgi:2'-5' RNA ligase
MTYSIWLVPSSKDAKYLNTTIQNLAKKHDAPKFSAHITVYSGISRLNAAKSAVRLLSPGVVCAKRAGIGQSEYVWKTLYIKIKKDKKLDHIHKTLQANLGAKYDFEPHISLIYKKMDNATKRKIRLGLKIKKSYFFDGVVIIRSSKNVSKWRTLYRSSLGAA